MELLLHEKLPAAGRGCDCTEQTQDGRSSQMLLCRNIIIIILLIIIIMQWEKAHLELIMEAN